MQQADQISMQLIVSKQRWYLSELQLTCLCFSQRYTAFSCTGEVLTCSDKVSQERLAREGELHSLVILSSSTFFLCLPYRVLVLSATFVKRPM